MSETKNLIKKIVSWIKSYAVTNGIDSLVVGVSGGIDSAVVERLCELTGLPVHCVAMPMEMHQDSNPDSLQNTMELCVNRGDNVKFYIRPIGSIVRAYLEAGIGVESDLLQGNVRSRIRANILYDFAGSLGGIVVGTGNKDEDEIGYFTKGGDGLVDICPLSLIHKSQVKKMSEMLEVPQSIIDAPPTAGLQDGQTDEGDLGMTYDEIEWALTDGKSGKEPEAKDKWLGPGAHYSENKEGACKRVKEKVAAMVAKNAHKLKYPPVFGPNK